MPEISLPGILYNFQHCHKRCSFHTPIKNKFHAPLSLVMMCLNMDFIFMKERNSFKRNFDAGLLWK